MTIREAKALGINKLKRASRKEAAIDTEILIAHVLGISREELLAHDERRVPSFALRRFRALLARRVKHEPIAYLNGHKEFFGLQFAVNKHTLIPRPETELIVEEALYSLSTIHYPLIIDVGTGSGAIAIAIAKNAPNTAIIATDMSKPALKIAELNAQTNGVADRIVFEYADLLPKRKLLNCIITANLPYLPTRVWQKCSPDVKKFEPKSALVGGKDGLKYYDELFHQIVERNIQAVIICEIDPSQKNPFPKLAKRHFPGAKVEIKNDLGHRPRIAIISL
jgi:release factor glutamine methyltransferase